MPSNWGEHAVRCRCGEDIRQWHSAAETRRVRRLYADPDGRIPACPACTTCRNNNRVFFSVAHAVRQVTGVTGGGLDR